MNISARAASAAVACLLASAPLHAAGSCDQCKDLPMLYRELLEQEFLRNLFDRWIREAYYPISVSAMQATALNSLNAAMSGNLYGAAAPGQGGSGGGGGAAPSYGTDMNTRDCALVEYYTDKSGELQQRPVSPAQVRARQCKPLADHILKHEGHHQASCKAAWAAGTSAQLGRVEFFAKDDRDAYQEGIGVLRSHIADLAHKCGWSGSTNARKPDGTMTVPTPEQVAQLKDSSKRKAGRLKRASK